LLKAIPAPAAAPPIAPTIRSHFVALMPAAAPTPAAIEFVILIDTLVVWPLADAVTRI